jgi:transposase
MIPNSNYYTLFNVTPEMPDLSVSAYGYTYLAQKSCKDMGLLDCIQNTFGDKTNEIISVAAYMIREGNAMDGIDDFQEAHFLPGVSKSLTSQSCSKLFESITPEQSHSFFEDWVKKALKNDTVCYDVTSISSYSKLIPSVEYGYNRDGEKLPQLNVGMFCCETSKLPLYYNVYNGSITDKTNLSYVLANAHDIGIKNVKLILDGGFISKDCFQSLKKSCYAFTIGIPGKLAISKNMIKANINKISNYANKLPKQEIFCVQQKVQIYGIDGKLMLYFDPHSHTILCRELSERIERLSDELSALKRCPISKLKRYAKYFIITKNKRDNGFNFVVNNETVDQLRQNKGFFLLFTTDMTAKPEDSLYFYRAKDADEKLFDQIKVDMKGGRFRTHNEQTTAGKIFVTFIALAIRSYMLGKFDQYMAANSLSLKKVLSKLQNISIVYSNGRCRFSKALTKEQKEILAPFDAVADIASSLDLCIR